MSDRPIGIFDSGVGGLTVCRAVHDALPEEDLIYFGDTARFPYGTRSPETIIRYSRQITEYLLKRDVKMIVIACNTASSTALDTLRSEYKIPIVGVVEAGARAACRNLAEKPVGVIGTRATVNSESYIQAIHSINSNVSVFQHHASLFVSLAEEGMTEGEIARLTVKEYIQDMYDKGVRRLILGCTHFPLLKNAITSVYSDIELIDTAMEVAREVSEELMQSNIAKENNNDNGLIDLYASDITETMTRLKDIFFSHHEIDIQKLIMNGEKHD